MSIGSGGTEIEAKGNVQIKRQQMTLKAEEVRINRETQDMEAKGNISVDDPEWKVKSADSMQFNLGKETGEIRNGDLFIEQGHVSILGRRFQKFGGQTYHIHEGLFTTCLCPSGPAPWRISAGEIDLTLGGTGFIKDGYFYIYDVPVLYIPYGFFPLRTERQSGFLFPQFGQSSEDGFRFLQPFFWAISKSSDATFSFDVETRSRLGVIGEYRTKFDRNSDFQFLASYFDELWRENADADIVDKTIADPHIPQNRWSVVGTHRYRTADNWLTYSDFAAYGDDLFTRELVDRYDLTAARERDIRVSRYGRSQFGAFRNWPDTFFKGQWDFYQDFIQPDKTTLQRTPQVSFWGRRLLRGFPLEFRWWAEGVNYLRRQGCPGDGSTDNCGDGLRLDLRPEIVLPFRMASYFFGAFSVAPRETAYHLYSPVKSSDRNVSREMVEVRGNIGTYLSRVFSLGTAGGGAIRHVIEPELSYLFVPSIDQSSIPIMDGVDRVRRRNVLTFAAANRLWRRFGSVSPSAPDDGEVAVLNPFISNVQEMGSLRLALTYDIDKERKGGDSLSDLDINLRLIPTGYLVFDFDGGVNPGAWEITQGRATLTFVDPRPIRRRALDPDFLRPNYFSIGYHYLINGPNGFLASNANIDLDAPANCARNPTDPRCPGAPDPKSIVGNLVASLFYHVTDNLLVSGSSVYDVRDSRFIGFRAATKLLSSCDCWTMTFSVNQSVNPSKTSF
ncbi:MAG TPA: LPS assembly protein LptD, partial [Candidatus Binatia bacterium]|nr:LPS assembly protein LptD [Candidatus Binatia bacterium]